MAAFCACGLVAWMERSRIQGPFGNLLIYGHSERATPDSAALHPGYGLISTTLEELTR